MIGAFVAAVMGGLVALLVVRLTNGQSQKQADRSRQMAAIADLVAAAEACAHEGQLGRDGLSSPENLLLMRSAWTRLKMSGKDSKDLAAVLQKWPYRMASLELEVWPRSERLTKEQVEAYEILTESAATLMSLLPQWPDANRADRAAHISLLTDQSEAIRLFLVKAGIEPEDLEASAMPESPGDAE